MVGSVWPSTPRCWPRWPRAGGSPWSRAPTGRPPPPGCWRPPSPPRDGPAVASNATGANMPAGHVAALVGSPGRHRRPGGGRGLPGSAGRGDGSPGRRPAQPVAGPAGPDLRGAHDGRPLADRPRPLAAPTGSPGTRGGRQRRRSHGGVGRPGRPRRSAGWGPDRSGATTRWAARRVAAASSSTAPAAGRATGARCARPERDAWVEGAALVAADGSRHRRGPRHPGPVQPGQRGHGGHGRPVHGRGAAIRSTAPASMVDGALARMASVDQVAGRFSATVRRGRPVRLLLAKNPAGWTALFDLLDEDAGRARRRRRTGGPLRQRPGG